MKPSYWLPLAAVAAGPVLAQPPAGGTPQVLLLADYRIVEGTVERVGADYHIRRGKDVETIPETQVIFAGESRDAVQRYLKTRTTAPPPGGADSAAVRGFPTKAQPVLMNLCAGCHAGPGNTSGFAFDRVREGYVNAEVGRRNAEAAIRFVNRDDPSASPLLVKAVTAHGGQKAPALKDRTAPAFQALELWVHQAAAADGPPKVKATSVPRVRAPAPVAGDPYDPVAFNRAAHPKR
jgi:hypothetical protein